MSQQIDSDRRTKKQKKHHQRNIKDSLRKNIPKRKYKEESSSSESEDIELDITDMFPLGVSTKNKHKKKKNPEEVMTFDFSDIFSMPQLKQDEDHNEKYLKSLPKNKRKKLEEQEKKILDMNVTTVPLRYKILESNLPEKTKAVMIQKVIDYENSNSGTSGFSKLKNYMDTLLKVPFGVYSKLPVSLNDPTTKISNFIGNMKDSLDSCIYGQNDAKMRILEIVAKWISNPTSNGNIIGLCGPPGVGKTTLIKKGLSSCIDIPFAFMPLGGCGDSTLLEGHNYTYEGSKNGKLVDILIENKCMNPIIFFDELDKVGNNLNGSDISGFLTHLTDYTQNDSIHDRYFADIEFDFSKCLFVFSFNDPSKINPILRDRITIINMKGFNSKEKLCIGRDFTTPKLGRDIGLKDHKYTITDETFRYIIDTYCSNEPGIRRLEKAIEHILMKVNLYQLTNNKFYLDCVENEGDNIIISKRMCSKILNSFFNVNEGTNLMVQMMYS